MILFFSFLLQLFLPFDPEIEKQTQQNDDIRLVYMIIIIINNLSTYLHVFGSHGKMQYIHDNGNKYVCHAFLWSNIIKFTANDNNYSICGAANKVDIEINTFY